MVPYFLPHKMSINNSDRVKFFFRPIEGDIYECNACKTRRKQNLTKGYTNLVSHIDKEHADWKDIMARKSHKNVFYEYVIATAKKKKYLGGLIY
jgi:hypothetical protein